VVFPPFEIKIAT